MNLAEDFVSTGDPFSEHARKGRGIIDWKRFRHLFNELLMASIGLLIRLSSMTSLLPRKSWLLSLIVLEGSTIPHCVPESRTILISKTSDTDDL